MAKKSAAKESVTNRSGSSRREPAVHPVTVQLSPPAYRIRQQAGLGLPNGHQLVEAVAGVMLGALASAVLITATRSSSPWFGAFLGASMGGVLAATGPIGTIPQEMGMGALAVASGWMYFDVSGQFQQPATVGQQGLEAQPPMLLPPSGRRSA